METFQKFLVFSPDYQRSIIFLSTENVNNSFLIDVDWKFPLNTAKPKLFLQREESIDNEDENQNNKESLEIKSLQNIAVAEYNCLLAYTASDKSLFIWKIDGTNTKIVSRRSFMRTSSCIRFSKCGQFLFLADKTGDVYEYPCSEENINCRGRWIFGHISQILDLQITQDFRYIITSDRDEKIRVTHYPRSHEINNFCLGHKEFVSAISVIENNFLISISGDKTLKFWNFLDGKDLHTYSFSFVPVLLKTIPLSSYNGFIFVSSIAHKVYILKYSLDDSKAITINELRDKQFKSDIEMSILQNECYIEYVNHENFSPEICIEKIIIKDQTVEFQKIFDRHILPTTGKNIKIYKSFDVPLLFKSGRMFDNVKQYIDRKKARIDSKKSKE